MEYVLLEKIKNCVCILNEMCSSVLIEKIEKLCISKKDSTHKETHLLNLLVNICFFYLGNYNIRLIYVDIFLEHDLV
jgi:hypothetical protein